MLLILGGKNTFYFQSLKSGHIGRQTQDTGWYAVWDMRGEVREGHELMFRGDLGNVPGEV